MHLCHAQLNIPTPKSISIFGNSENKMSDAAEASSFMCSVCQQNVPLADKVTMPCCGTNSSTVQLCRSCIETIVQNGIRSSIGRCPACRSYFVMQGGLPVTQTSVPRECMICFQVREITDPSLELCSACMLGTEYSFRYECNRCHSVQTIPHPMWLYQPTPSTFTGATWACHHECKDYTNWRIVPDDQKRVPLDHIPEEWGMNEKWLAAIRKQREKQAAGSDHSDDMDD